MGSRKRRFVTHNVCRLCGEDKPADNFLRNPDGSIRKNTCYRCAYLRDRVVSKDGKYRAAYGIGTAEVEAKIAEQCGLCSICGGPPTGRGKNSVLHVDHDHKSGKVREMLCSFCNSGLGYFKDDTDLMRKAIEYINRHKEET